MYMEFDRDPQINVIDVIDLKKDQLLLKQKENVKVIEIEAAEYAKMRQRMYDLEVQNSLLQNQVILLKSHAMKRVGTAKDLNKELYQQKLQ